MGMLSPHKFRVSWPWEKNGDEAVMFEFHVVDERKKIESNDDGI